MLFNFSGHPMKLTYFVSPYEILELKKELSLDLISQKNIGCSVTICLEGSAAHKLQTAPLITINKNSSKRYNKLIYKQKIFYSRTKLLVSLIACF